MNSGRTWQVLLIGGASGVGKTSVSYRLAAHFGVGITEVDDFQVVLQRMTSPAEQPILHYERTHAEAASRWGEDDRLAHMLRLSAAMAPAIELVIANHIESRAPIVLEGDFLLPELAVRPAYAGVPGEGEVRGLFLYEEDEAQLARNYLAREGTAQPRRARASWRHSEWLRGECARLGVAALPARPWDTALARCIAAIDGR
jgi:2-phosphoglycerate kinase